MATARRQIVRAMRLLDAEGLVGGSTGNVSVRSRTGFLITPTRRRYDSLRAREIVACDGEGRGLSRRRQPSSETLLHALLYAARPDVNAVVHHHGPYSTAASFLGGELSPRLEEAVYYAIGAVRTAPRAPIGSRELAEGCAEALGAGKAVLLEGHGMVAVEESLPRALDVARAVEHEARVGHLLRSMGVLDAPPGAAQATPGGGIP